MTILPVGPACLVSFWSRSAALRSVVSSFNPGMIAEKNQRNITDKIRPKKQAMFWGMYTLVPDYKMELKKNIYNNNFLNNNNNNNNIIIIIIIIITKL